MDRILPFERTDYVGSAGRRRDSHHGSREFVRWGSEDLRGPSVIVSKAVTDYLREESSWGLRAVSCGKRSDAEEEIGEEEWGQREDADFGIEDEEPAFMRDEFASEPPSSQKRKWSKEDGFRKKEKKLKGDKEFDKGGSLSAIYPDREREMKELWDTVAGADSEDDQEGIICNRDNGVHYKFKSSKDYKSLVIEGPSISVADLKLRIVESMHLKRRANFILMVFDVQTNEGIKDCIILKSMCACGATNILADDLVPNKNVRDLLESYQLVKPPSPSHSVDLKRKREIEHIFEREFVKARDIGIEDVASSKLACVCVSSFASFLLMYYGRVLLLLFGKRALCLLLASIEREHPLQENFNDFVGICLLVRLILQLLQYSLYCSL
ncbi:hypothetical protein Syun_029337 [Stephania yunnanensis]|uniref:DWNN domain-containing protein n=1 Tax=Stephania yunnanensis TaxID=152371 RepID=A0AAP0E8F2_9MAGN